MNIYKKYYKGFSIIELMVYVSLFSIAIVAIGSVTSLLYKGYKKFNVKQDSQIAFNTFQKQLKIDLMEVAVNRLIIQNNGITIRRDVWDNNQRQLVANGRIISYQNTCIPDNQGNNFPLIPAILGANANNINAINNAINARMQRFPQNLNFIGCIGNTVPMIERTERVNNVIVRTQFYPGLNAGTENVNLSGTIAATMFVGNCNDGVNISVLRASLNNATVADVDVQEGNTGCISFNNDLNILR